MEPNYNFCNEIAEQHSSKNWSVSSRAESLYSQYNVIGEKEMQVIKWIICNLSMKSIIRESMVEAVNVKYRMIKLSKSNNGQQSIKF